MKKKLLKAGFCLVAVLLTGAVAVTTVDKLVIDPKIISSWGELTEAYSSAREELPPVPDFPNIGNFNHAFSKPCKLLFQPLEKMV